ncbi:MAG: peptidyl-prolyl cis-trans isomerase [Xanthomonadaceae bacterium]|jgi:peptidyl-prolyl cis-trans isomerase C|nr:peptidyl-prolyl cis-trans isomerase [Xanthomonadaceae bacterium]
MSHRTPLSISLAQLPVTDASPHGHAARTHHGHADEGAPGNPGQPAPCYLFVGETAISEADIAREMQHHRAMTPERSRADAARALVVRELLRREIERLGLRETEPPSGRETGEEAGIRLLLEREIEDRTPTEDDCLRYYQQNRKRFREPDRIRVRHILLPATPDDVDERLRARALGEKLIGELRESPALFADFALRHSACPSRQEGGDLGWLQRGQTTPEFDRQIFRLREGLAAYPVESRWGHHVVDVVALAPGREQSFGQARQRISDHLELQLCQSELHHYMRGLMQRYAVRGLDEIEAAAG